MVYETAVLFKAGTESALEKADALLTGAIKDFNGEVLFKDDWGERVLCQPTSKGADRGHYTYFIYKSSPASVEEFNRKLRLDESVMKSIVIKLGEDKNADALLKNYSATFHNAGEK